MKRQIVSPLCSAFIIPGLGQILNHHLKKGLAILGIVFLLFLAVIFSVTYTIISILERTPIEPDPEVIMAKFREEDFTLIWFIIIAFGIVWLYSIIDAFLKGRKIDKEKDGVLK